MNTGQDLIDFINNNNWLKILPIERTFIELLNRNIIKPSEIIDAHTRVLNDKLDRYKCHYEDSCVSAMQLFNGNFNKLNTAGTAEIQACGDMSEDAHSAHEAPKSLVSG